MVGMAISVEVADANANTGTDIGNRLFNITFDDKKFFC